MNKRVSAWLVLATFGLTAFACVNPAAAPPMTAPPAAGPREARQFPEVEILTAEGDLMTVKLVRLDSDGRVVVLHSPYWGVETKTMALADIHSLQLLGKASPMLRGAMAGFALVAAIAGGLFLATSSYDEDFSAGLRNAPIVGGVLGVPLGLLTGSGSAAANPSKFDFTRMSEARRLAALRKLMGI